MIHCTMSEGRTSKLSKRLKPLITQNGLATNKLMGFAELDKLTEADMTKEH